MAHQRYLGDEAAGDRREVLLYRGALPEAPAAALAALLLGKTATPGESAVRISRKIRIQGALNGMDALDREVLALRHFSSNSSNAETALVLGLTESAACNTATSAAPLEQLLSILEWHAWTPSLIVPRSLRDHACR